MKRRRGSRDLRPARLCKFVRHLELRQQFSAEIGGVCTVLRIAGVRLLARDEGGDEQLADGTERHGPPRRPVALVRDCIEIDDEIDIEPVFLRNGGDKRRRCARARRTVLLVGNREEQEIGIATIGLHRRDCRRKACLHVEKPAAGKERSTFEIGQRPGVLARAAQLRHDVRQKPLRREGERLQRAIIRDGHHVEVPRQQNAVAAAPPLQREDVRTVVAGDWRGPGLSGLRHVVRQPACKCGLLRRSGDGWPGRERQSNLPRPRRNVIAHARDRS